MGISALSSINLSGTVSNNSGVASETSTVTGDFASLFIEQLSASIAGLVVTSEQNSELIPGEIIAKEEKGDIDEDSGDLNLSQLSNLAELNPALFAPVTPAPKSMTQDSFDAVNVDLLNGKRNAIPSLLPNESDSTETISSTQLKDNPIGSNSGTDKKAGNFSEILANSRITNSHSTPAATTRNPTDPAGGTLPESANFAAAPTLPEGNSLNAIGTSGGSSNQIKPREYNSLGKMEISTPIRESQWASNLGEKIVWLTRNDQQTAQININPPQLGPMQISLNMNGDQATAMFASPHAEVRQAIEDAMPRLREMLSSAGITLGDANVGTQLPQQNRDNAPQFTNTAPNGGRITNENDILGKDSQIGGTSGSLPVLRGRGLVDLFA